MQTRTRTALATTCARSSLQRLAWPGAVWLTGLLLATQASAAPISTSIKVDHFGYRPTADKVAVFTEDPGTTVEVRDTSDRVIHTVTTTSKGIIYKGPDPYLNPLDPQRLPHSGDKVWTVDFSGLTAAGTYRLYSPTLGKQSYDFTIRQDVYVPVVRTALKTFYYQRCNTPKTAAHAGSWADEAACHTRDTTTGPKVGQPHHGTHDLSNGWHDAGDYNKYVWADTARALYFLLSAYELNPNAFVDGDLNIPESGNGVPDLLDEVKWELDWMLKMQLDNGSVLSRVHNGELGHQSPPSADTKVRSYEGPNIEAAAVLAGSFSHASRIYRSQGMTAYANTLQSAAERAWAWLSTQSETGQKPEVMWVKLWAAAELFRTNPSLTGARNYVDGFKSNLWLNANLSDPLRFDTLAALTYVLASGAHATVITNMRQALAAAVDVIRYHSEMKDYYGNGMQQYAYHWGSNTPRAAHGVFLLKAAQLGTLPSNVSPEKCRKLAEEFLHYFHGKNPLSMVYLTNMAALGGEHSSWQPFHHWFGDANSSYARARYIGKPSSVVEPDYPYYREIDNHKVSDNNSSLLGPAPGFVPGGPHKDYGAQLSGDCTDPTTGSSGGTAVQPLLAKALGKFYRDWNDVTWNVQERWRACPWRINENSIASQGAYVALGAYFVRQPPRGFLDLVSGDLLEGWAQDPDAPEATTQVELSFDGEAGSGVLSLRIQANRYRADLCTALGSCNHAFSITPPSQFCDGQSHRVYAYGVDIADGVLVPLYHSPKSFSCRLPRARGGLDKVSATAIEGWVQDLDAPEATAYVDLYFDGEAGSGVQSLRVQAGLYRGDLCTRIGSCNHGFSIKPPPQFCDGLSHTVYAYEPGIENDHVEQLAKSPKSFSCPVPSP